ncbi:glucosylceramidase [Gammaproteobacteria bacterium]
MNSSSAITFWLTHSNQSALLQRQVNPLSFTNTTNGCQKIQVDATHSYQPMEGFGFSLTGGSAYLINQLTSWERDRLLRETFSSENDGIGVSYLRVSIGASDLSATTFSYDDMPIGQTDPGLIHFDLNAGDLDLIPVLREIIAINPQIKIMGTPWSAPPWMKDNNSFVGGSLRSEYYQVYADYFVRYLRAMRDNGIYIHALTLQNEPLNKKNDPSMVMKSAEQADFIKNYLGPALWNAGLQEVELFCWDHNCDEKRYPIEVLNILDESNALNYLAGVAWHLYAGDASSISDVHYLYPEMKMAFTEQWVGRDGNFAGDLIWHMKNVMVGTIRNWSRVVLEWNLASDPVCRPHTRGGEPNCVGALTIDVDGEEKVRRNVSYYVIAHAAKFVCPGSVRISSTSIDSLPNVAFKTPTGGIVLIVLNATGDQQTFGIQFDERVATTTLAGGSVGTYVW